MTGNVLQEKAGRFPINIISSISEKENYHLLIITLQKSKEYLELNFIFLKTWIKYDQCFIYLFNDQSGPSVKYLSPKNNQNQDISLCPEEGDSG